MHSFDGSRLNLVGQAKFSIQINGPPGNSSKKMLHALVVAKEIENLIDELGNKYPKLNFRSFWSDDSAQYRKTK